MTIIEAINKVDTLKPNSYTQLDKIRWLSDLDGVIKTEIIDTHEGGENITFKGYDENTDISTELLVSAPYEDIYIKWLEAKIDYANAEYGKYNNSVTAYNAAYSLFERYYNRTHMPKSVKSTYFGGKPSEYKGSISTGGGLSEAQVKRIVESETEGLQAKVDDGLETESKSVVSAINEVNSKALSSIEQGAGNGSIQQVADGVANGFDFTGKNPNATAVDATLTGTIPYGATGAYASSFGGKSSAQGKRSNAEGTTTIAKGNYSHAEGDNSVAIGNDSHAEGYTTTSAGTASHAEGYSSVAKGRVSHAEGQETTASGEISHAEGFKTTASGNISHAEGNNTNAKGLYSHAEGSWTNAEGDMSHAEGSNTLAKGTASHAGGNVSNAGGNNSFAHGDHVKVYYENQAVFGQYNEPKTDTIFEIGNGKSENERNNAFEVCKDGTVRVNGKPLEANGGGTKLYKHTITGVYGKTISNTIEFEVTNLVIVAYSDKPATDNISLTSLDIEYGVNAYVPHYGKIVNILDTMLDEVTVYYHNRVIGGEVMQIILNTTNIVDTVIEL